jgi:hypothetical protein
MVPNTGFRFCRASSLHRVGTRYGYFLYRVPEGIRFFLKGDNHATKETYYTKIPETGKTRPVRDVAAIDSLGVSRSHAGRLHRQDVERQASGAFRRATGAEDGQAYVVCNRGVGRRALCTLGGKIMRLILTMRFSTVRELAWALRALANRMEKGGLPGPGCFPNLYDARGRIIGAYQIKRLRAIA